MLALRVYDRGPNGFRPLAAARQHAGGACFLHRNRHFVVQPIADVLDRDQPGAQGRQLPPETRDVDVYRPVVAGVVLLPDLGKQLVTRDDAPNPREDVAQDEASRGW